MTVPFASGLATLTTSWTVPEAPAASEAIDQVTTEPERVPLPAETNEVFAGRVSVRRTAVASALPLLAYDRVYVRVAPAATGSGASVETTPRTGADITVVVMPGPLTEPVSLLAIAYEAWVISVPLGRGLAMRTTSCTEPETPAASEPIDQVTTEPERVPPAVALTKVVSTGTVSLISTPVAATLPEFEY